MLFKKPFTLIGAVPSPYTRKLVALLRYRRIDYRVIWGDLKKNLDLMGISPPKVTLLPTCIIEVEEGVSAATCDTTPIIRQLEESFDSRKVIPSDPVLAFLDYLVEDYADEWCTKFMFHYRWHPEEDAKNAAKLLPILQEGVSISSDQHDIYSDYIYDRQVGRLGVVGSNKVTADLIEQSYIRTLRALDNHFEQYPFILGSRPSASDFALYGQLSQLIGFDPTPRALAHKFAPRVVSWTSLMEDQCGIETRDDEWNIDLESPTFKKLLTEIGCFYVPALLANKQAYDNDKKEWSTLIERTTWSQNTFSYQAKCLQWIRDEFCKLSDKNKQKVLQVLDGTKCKRLFSNG